LDLPHVAWARKLTFDRPDLLQVERLLDHGYDLVEVRLPALITVVKEINEPRLPSFKAKLRAKSATIPVLSMADLGLDEHQAGFKGSYTRVVKVFPPPARGQREILQGSPETIAAALWSRLQQLQGR
jgi:electron transfer flavoprotein beta subunit